MSSGKVGKRPLRSLTAHEKLDAIRRVHDGESKASVARDIGVPESTLRGWCKNEDKISYLSRQSSPENDESSLPSYEPKEKKQKIEETTITTTTTTKIVTPTTGIIAPFNLNIKPTLPYSTNDDAIKISPDNNILSNLNTSSLSSASSSTIPMNLTTSASSLLSHHVSAKSNVTSGCSSTMSEREKNRAELARLSVEFGLNRPEMFLPGGSSSNGNVADFSTNLGILAHQWKNVLAQQQINKSSSLTMASNKPKQAKVDSTSTSAAINLMQNYTKLIDNKRIAAAGDPLKSVEDNVWCWLKSQQAILTQNIQQQTASVNNNTLPTVSTSACHSIVPTTAPPSLPLKSSTTNTGFDLNNSSWFWKWYKQYTSQLQNVLVAANPTNKLILAQQLSKMNSENLETGDEAEQPIATRNGLAMITPVAAVSVSSASSNRSRSVLDNILLNNNNVSAQDQKEGKEDYLSQSEALEHGEKFLKWLECCSEPSVTAMQIMQFRSLINNIKTSSERKSGEQKTKVRRK